MISGAYLPRGPRLRLPRRRQTTHAHACAQCSVAAGAHPTHLVLDTAQLELVVAAVDRLLDDRCVRHVTGLAHLAEFLKVRLAVARRNDRRAAGV